MTFRVTMTQSAEADADENCDWLKARSLNGATNWWKSFLHAIESLRRNADSFGDAAELREGDEALRELNVKTRYGHTFRLVFTIRSEIAYFLRVRGTSQPLISRDDIEFPD